MSLSLRRPVPRSMISTWWNASPTTVISSAEERLTRPMRAGNLPLAIMVLARPFPGAHLTSILLFSQMIIIRKNNR